jgi:fucose 4-O-acetylase-like acetyltransferase
MNLEYLVFAILMLFTRLIYLRNDGPLSRWQTVGLGVFQVALLTLVFQWSLANMGAILTVSMIAILAVLTRNVLDPAKGYRLLGLLGLLVIPAYIGSFGQGFVFTPGFLAVVGHLHHHLPILGNLDTASVTRA